MNCKRCNALMERKEKTSKEIEERLKECTTWIYGYYFKCPECAWQYMPVEGIIYPNTKTPR
jgi:hypothetical protein